MTSSDPDMLIQSRRGMDDGEPGKGVERYEEQKRRSLPEQRRPSRDCQLQRALDKSNDAANTLRLLLLTGSRLGEALKETWDQFDLTRGIWTKPSHHAKQKKTEHVPLSAPALDLLERMKQSGSRASGPLFPGADGKKARFQSDREPDRPDLGRHVIDQRATISRDFPPKGHCQFGEPSALGPWGTFQARDIFRPTPWRSP
jgi:integrase